MTYIENGKRVSELFITHEEEINYVQCYRCRLNSPDFIINEKNHLCKICESKIKNEVIIYCRKCRGRFIGKCACT